MKNIDQPIIQARINKIQDEIDVLVSSHGVEEPTIEELYNKKVRVFEEAGWTWSIRNGWTDGTWSYKYPSGFRRI